MHVRVLVYVHWIHTQDYMQMMCVHVGECVCVCVLTPQVRRYHYMLYVVLLVYVVVCILIVVCLTEEGVPCMLQIRSRVMLMAQGMLTVK